MSANRLMKPLMATFPEKFEPGAPVPVRLDGDRMFVKRPNGKVLETKIVQQIS